MTDATDLRPSQILVLDPCPLTATFDRHRIELAAAVMIITLAANGDTWRPVRLREIGEHLGALANGPRPPSWLTSPVFRPDMLDMVARGFAVLSGEDGTPERAIAFTEEGLERLRRSRWIRPAAA